MADGPTPQGSNDRVTLARLSEKLDNLIEMLRQDHEETRAWRRASEERQRLLEAQCQQNKTDIARLDERQKATTGFLGIFTLIASTIAGAVGAVYK